MRVSRGVRVRGVQKISIALAPKVPPLVELKPWSHLDEGDEKPTSLKVVLMNKDGSMRKKESFGFSYEGGENPLANLAAMAGFHCSQYTLLSCGFLPSNVGVLQQDQENS